MRKFIGLRLRKKKDQDIVEALKGIEDGEISELIRKGIRLILKAQKEPPNVKQEAEKQKTATKVTVWNFPK